MIYNADFSEKAYESVKEMSVEDKQFMKIDEDSAKIVNGHYNLKLPFKKYYVALPNNRQMAEQHLEGLKRKFKRNPVFHEEYASFLSDVISKGFTEIVPKEELKGTNGKVWYIPHHDIQKKR